MLARMHPTRRLLTSSLIVLIAACASDGAQPPTSPLLQEINPRSRDREVTLTLHGGQQLRVVVLHLGDERTEATIKRSRTLDSAGKAQTP